jgi:hypothetical protein
LGAAKRIIKTICAIYKIILLNYLLKPVIIDDNMTETGREQAMIIRKARLSDTEAIHMLVNFYAKKGLMLARSRSSLYENIRNYSVMEDNGEVIGVGALTILWVDLAEIRTLAVNESFSGMGIGKKAGGVLFIMRQRNWASNRFLR